MRKKVLDILPGDTSAAFMKKLGVLQESEKSKKSKKPKKPFLKNNKKTLWFFILLSLVFVLVIGFGFSISKAEIKIWPVAETKVLETDLVIDTGVQSSDFENKIILGQVFETEETASKVFSASGKTLKKAEGIIRLYNAYSTKSETWLQGTRFVSAEGKLFKSKNKINVPGADIQDGKIVPRYVDVPVIAAEAGQDYNIDPSHFSIFVYRGTPRYTKFYGESLEPMAGGGESPQVTEDDLAKAKDVLIDEIKEKSINSLKQKIGDEYVFLKDLSKTEITDELPLAQAGDERDKFSFRIEAEASIIIFEKQKINKFAKDLISSEIPEGKLFYEDSLDIEYVPQAIDWESKRINVSLNLSYTIYPEADLQSMKKSLMGKSLNETKIFLENQPEFKAADIKFWPFWVTSVPKDLEKIEIDYPLI